MGINRHGFLVSPRAGFFYTMIGKGIIMKIYCKTCRYKRYNSKLCKMGIRRNVDDKGVFKEDCDKYKMIAYSLNNRIRLIPPEEETISPY